MPSETTQSTRLFRTISSRLTIWGAGITLTVCAVLSVALYAGLYASLYDEIDSFLQGEVPEFMVTVNAHPGDASGLQQAIRRELGSRARHDLAFRLFDERARLLVTSENEDRLADLWVPPEGWNRDPPHFVSHTIRLGGKSGVFRTCSLRVTTEEGRACTAQVSYSLDRMDASLADFRQVCAIGLILAAILSVLSGRVLAKRSLQPVQTLAATAERIGAGGLSERIPLKGTDDELDRLAATLNGMLDRIERHVRRVQQFTADASHEIRSPLAALRGTAEVALTKPRTNDELRQVLEDGIEHYDRLSRIAEDLLLLARVDAGHDIVTRGPVHLAEALSKVVDLYIPLAQDRGIELVLTGHEATTLDADGGRLRQLAGNLIDNAIKFTDAGGRVGVSFTTDDAVVRIKLVDTGHGISADRLPHVFDRFYRADQARSTRNGGAGLGLPICRAIAEAHGGRIDIESTPGDGTTVTVTLPLNGKNM